MSDYLTDPGEIEKESFRLIRAQTDLSEFNEDQAQVVMRLVHTCGDPDVAGALRFSPEAISNGISALTHSARLLCDVEMLKQGISHRFCRGPIHCFLNQPEVADRARLRSHTRSMTALDFWGEHLAGSVAAIGNAPTALFRLLELLADSAPTPALVIGMPVGFVGAAESKEALVECAPKLGIEYITLTGRQGGSALAAATVNALARLAHGVRC